MKAAHLSLLFVLAGCAARDAGYREMRQLVQERTGNDVRSWHLEDDGQIDEKVKQLLAKPLGAEEAVQLAMYNSPNLQAALEEIGIARAELVGASLLPNPEVEARIGFVKDRDAEIGLAATENLSRLIFLPMRRGVANAELEAARLRVAGTALELGYEVRRAFYQYQAAQQIVELRQTVLEATAASYELAKRLHEAGNITDLDFANERGFHEESRFAVADAEVAALEQREMLNRLIGLSGRATAWQLAGRLPDPPEKEPPLADLERRAIERSLGLRELEQNYVAAARRANLARAEALVPELRAGISAEREDAGWEVGPMVALELPIFDQGQGSVGIARADMRRIQHQFTAHAIDVRSAIRAAQAQLVTASRRARYYQEVLLPLRRQIVTETQRQYNAMQIGAFQLIAARQSEIETGREYVTALRSYWGARAALDQILAGRLVDLSGMKSAFTEAPGPRMQGGH